MYSSFQKRVLASERDCCTLILTDPRRIRCMNTTFTTSATKLICCHFLQNRIREPQEPGLTVETVATKPENACYSRDLSILTFALAYSKSRLGIGLASEIGNSSIQ